MDFFFDMAISIILATLKQVIKNPEKKAALKRVFLKLRNGINAAYADDPDFD